MNVINLLIAVPLFLSQADGQSRDDQQPAIPNPHLAAAAESLAEAVAHESEPVTGIAVRALDAMGEYARPAVPALIQHVHNNFREGEPGGADFAAIHVLVKFGTEARAINPILVRLLSQQGAWASPDWQAMNALIAIGPDADTVPLLIDVIQSGNAEACSHAAQVLGHYGQIAESAVPVLAAKLDEIEVEDRIRLAVVRALAEIGPRGVAAVVRRYNNTNDKSARLLIVHAIATMEGDASAAEDFLAGVAQEAGSNERLPPALVERVRKTLWSIRAKKNVSPSQ